MTDFQKVLASDHEIAHVCNSARDLHWSFIHDRDSREYLKQPTNIRMVELARNQLDEVIRKAKFSAPASGGACREVRQAETHHEPV